MQVCAVRIIGDGHIVDEVGVGPGKIQGTIPLHLDAYTALHINTCIAQEVNGGGARQPNGGLVCQVDVQPIVGGRLAFQIENVAGLHPAAALHVQCHFRIAEQSKSVNTGGRCASDVTGGVGVAN